MGEVAIERQARGGSRSVDIVAQESGGRLAGGGEALRAALRSAGVVAGRPPLSLPRPA